jgi:hypothetical protein
VIEPLMNLTADPYHPGTDNYPEFMAKNLRRLMQASWPLVIAKHIPMIGEWVALPVYYKFGGVPGARNA